MRSIKALPTRYWMCPTHSYFSIRTSSPCGLASRRALMHLESPSLITFTYLRFRRYIDLFQGPINLHRYRQTTMIYRALGFMVIIPLLILRGVISNGRPLPSTLPTVFSLYMSIEHSSGVSRYHHKGCITPIGPCTIKSYDYI